MPTFADSLKRLPGFFIYKTSPRLDMDAAANCDALPELPLRPVAVTVTIFVSQTNYMMVVRCHKARAFILLTSLPQTLPLYLSDTKVKANLSLRMTGRHMGMWVYGSIHSSARG